MVGTEITYEDTCSERSDAAFVLDPAVGTLLQEIANDSKKKGRGRPKLIHRNTVRAQLASFGTTGSALATLPGLDRVVTGAVNLDLGGNTRPLSKRVVVSMLQRLDVISTESVLSFMQRTNRDCETRHAQKIAQCLRVIEKSASRIAQDRWPAATAYPIDPCGNPECVICTAANLTVALPPTEALEFDESDLIEPD